MMHHEVLPEQWSRLLIEWGGGKKDGAIRSCFSVLLLFICSSEVLASFSHNALVAQKDGSLIEMISVF